MAWIHENGDLIYLHNIPKGEYGADPDRPLHVSIWYNLQHLVWDCKTSADALAIPRKNWRDVNGRLHLLTIAAGVATSLTGVNVTTATPPSPAPLARTSFPRPPPQPPPPPARAHADHTLATADRRWSRGS